jgi:hypothetical protein
VCETALYTIGEYYPRTGWAWAGEFLFNHLLMPNIRAGNKKLEVFALFLHHLCVGSSLRALRTTKAKIIHYFICVYCRAQLCMYNMHELEIDWIYLCAHTMFRHCFRPSTALAIIFVLYCDACRFYILLYMCRYIPADVRVTLASGGIPHVPNCWPFMPIVNLEFY